MAIVRFDGVRVRCEIISGHPQGWLCKSQQHANRLRPGTEFLVGPDDILQRDPPPDIVKATVSKMGEMIEASRSQQSLDAAMAKERETLPTPQELIQSGPPIAHDAPNKVETKT